MGRNSNFCIWEYIYVEALFGLMEIKVLKTHYNYYCVMFLGTCYYGSNFYRFPFTIIVSPCQFRTLKGLKSTQMTVLCFSCCLELMSL